MYPLSKFTGRQETKDWTKVPSFPNTSTGDEETKWVQPESFFDELGAILKEVPPCPGRRLSMPTCKVSSMRPRGTRSSMELWSHRRSMPTRISLRHCFSSTTADFRYPTTGPPSTTAQRSAPIITAELLWPNRTSSKLGPRDQVFLSGRRRHRRTVKWKSCLQRDLCQRTTSTRQGILVAYSLQPTSFLLPQRD